MNLIKSSFLAIAVLLTSTTIAQSHQVDVNKSNIKWEGKKIGGAHHGAIKLKEGSFTVKENTITEGTFIIDMSSISNIDIEDLAYRKKLIGHLKSDDFFNVEKYPTAQLEITNSSPFTNDKAKVTGNLTIKGKTHPVHFEVIRMGNKFTSQLTIDRAQYDIRYGSKSFFDNLGDKVIYDDFTLEATIITQ